MSSRTITEMPFIRLRKLLQMYISSFMRLDGQKALTEVQRRQFMNVTADMDDVIAQSALQDLSYYCYFILWQEGDYPAG